MGIIWIGSYMGNLTVTHRLRYEVNETMRIQFYSIERQRQVVEVDISVYQLMALTRTRTAPPLF